MRTIDFISAIYFISFSPSFKQVLMPPGSYWEKSKNKK